MFFIIASICFPIAVQAQWDGLDRGPLRTKIQSPPYLMFLTPVPETPELLPVDSLSASMSIDYSSTFLYAKSRDWYTLIDMEVMVLDFSMEYRATDKLSLMANIPMVRMKDGFLDPLLEDFHALFNLNEYGRSYRPENTFEYNVSVNNQDWIDSRQSGLTPADGSLSAKYIFIDESTTEGLTAAISYFLKMPTGDTSKGLSSGKFDHGFFLLARTQNFPFIFYLNTGIIFLTDPDTMGPDIRVNNTHSLFIGTEYVMNKKCSLLLQLNYLESPFMTGIGKLDNGNLDLSLGAIWDIRPDMGFELAFSEDLSQSGTPDFTIHGRVFRRWELK